MTLCYKSAAHRLEQQGWLSETPPTSECFGPPSNVGSVKNTQ